MPNNRFIVDRSEYLFGQRKPPGASAQRSHKVSRGSGLHAALAVAIAPNSEVRGVTLLIGGYRLSVVEGAPVSLADLPHPLRSRDLELFGLDRTDGRLVLALAFDAAGAELLPRCVASEARVAVPVAEDGPVYVQRPRITGAVELSATVFGPGGGVDISDVAAAPDAANPSAAPVAIHTANYSLDPAAPPSHRVFGDMVIVQSDDGSFTGHVVIG